MLTFAMSWLGTTVFGLQHDLYNLIYFTFALGYLAVFARRSAYDRHCSSLRDTATQ